MFKLGKNSKKNLVRVHIDLCRVVKLALSICEIDFGISEGDRSKAKQRRMVNKGKSTTMNSRHIVDKIGACYAVDLFAYVDGKASYKPRHMKMIAKAMFKAAIELGVDMEWGGHWSNLNDMPHYQLSWAMYPPAK